MLTKSHFDICLHPVSYIQGFLLIGSVVPEILGWSGTFYTQLKLLNLGFPDVLLLYFLFCTLIWAFRILHLGRYNVNFLLVIKMSHDERNHRSIYEKLPIGKF